MKVKVEEKTKGSEAAAINRAILDSGSDQSYCTWKLVDQLQVKRRPITLTIGTLVSEDEMNLEEVGLKVTSVRIWKKRLISFSKVIVVESLPPALQTAAVNAQDVIPWNHLRGTGPYYVPEEVDLLIGQDVLQALVSLEVGN